MNYDKNLLYGRLKILEEVDKDKYGKRMVKTICTCDSNKIQIKDLYSIWVGKNKSCGCLQKEIGYIQSQKNRKQNIYDLTKEYGIGYTFKGEEFYFDLEDYDKIKNIRISLEKEYFREYRYAWENEIDINKLIEYENKLKNNKEE